MHTSPEFGQYPYPRNDDNFDSPALEWLRNHSSYLTASGFLGTIGAGAIYLRGVIGNLLIVTPILMAAGIFLGWFHRSIIDSTLFIIGAYAAFVGVLFVIYYGITTFNQTRNRPVRESSQPLRMILEGKPNQNWPIRLWLNAIGILQAVTRQFAGSVVVSGVVVLLVVASPRIIEVFWRSPVIEGFSFQQCLGVIVGLVTVAGTVSRRLLGWGKYGTMIGIAVITVIGISILWLITLRIATYIYYGTPPTGDRLLIPFVLACAVLFAALTACVGGLVRKPRQIFWLSLPSVVAAAALCIVCWSIREHIGRMSSEDSDDLMPLTQSVSRLSKTLLPITDKGDDGSSNDASDIEEPKKHGKQTPALDTFKELNNISRQLALRYQAGALEDKKNLNPEDYALAQHFLHTGESLSNLSLGQRQELLNELTKICVRELVRRHRGQVGISMTGENSADRTSESVQHSTSATDGSASNPQGLPGVSTDWSSVCQESVFLEVLREQPELWKRLLTLDEKKPSERARARMVKNVTSGIDHINQLQLKLSEIDQSKNNTSAGPSSRDPINATLDLNDVLSDRLSASNSTDVAKESIEDVITMKLEEVIHSIISVQDLSESFSAADAAGLFERVERRPWANMHWFDNREYEVQKAETNRKDFVSTLVSKSITDKLGDLEPTIRRVIMPKRMSSVPWEINLADESSQEPNDEKSRVASIMKLVRLALCGNEVVRRAARESIGELYDPSICSWTEIKVNGTDIEERELLQRDLQNELYIKEAGADFPIEGIRLILAAHLSQQNSEAANQLIRRMVAGQYGNMEGLDVASHELFVQTRNGRLWLMLACGGVLLVFNCFFNSPNHTSVHSFYRDRLRTAFIVGPVVSDVQKPGTANVSSRERVLLSDIAGKIKNASGPYPLICAALNLQGSSDESIRDRHASSFAFTPMYVGSDKTGYVPTKELEAYDTDLTADSAMAISAAAAAPNMGKYTVSWVSFLIVLLNIRLGRWLPHPESICKSGTKKGRTPVGFEKIRRKELVAIARRQKNAKLSIRDAGRFGLNDKLLAAYEKNLFGLALSGGGIRSASVSLGVTQTLHQSGLFKEIDYLSSVSGGGYTGTAISTFMGTAGTAESRSLPVPRVGNLQRWLKIPPSRYLLREMTGLVRENLPWIYISDGGHFENLAAYELLKRKARIIIISDGEADSTGTFGGLSSLMRLAEIDLDTRIVFDNCDLEKMRLKTSKDADSNDCWKADSHHAVGRIFYGKLSTNDNPDGWLIYIRSTLLEDEDTRLRSSSSETISSLPH